MFTIFVVYCVVSFFYDVIFLLRCPTWYI